MTAQPDLEQFTTTGWPWRLGNEFRLLNDGGEFFARMLAAIEEARRYVLLEMYLVRSGAVATRFIDALGRAAGRGARVSVVFDGFGALGLTRADRRRLLDAGVELRFFNPLRLGNRLSNLLRDHRKLLLANGVLRHIDSATARAWIMSAYFVPSRRFRKALRRAARRGVDVRLLLPGARTDHPWVRQAARRFYGKLLRNGVKIFEYQPRMLHAKMILCDDWVSIGSSNLDRWSFRWNLEANQEIADADFANAAAAVFAGDFAVSRALSRRYWRQRAWLDRLRETIAGVLDRELDRWR